MEAPPDVVDRPLAEPARIIHADEPTLVPTDTRYTPSPDFRAQVEGWFGYHPPQPDQPERYKGINDRAAELAMYILYNSPASAEQTLALRKLQECRMWANASIAINEA